jgi:hypothetical protein
MLRLSLFVLVCALYASACDDGFDAAVADSTPDPDEPALLTAELTRADLEATVSPGLFIADESARFPVAAALTGPGDRDWHPVHVDAAGAAVDAELSTGRGCASGAALELALYTSDRSTLTAYQRHAGCARIHAGALAAGTYYLRVGGSRALAYTLDAKVTAP